MLFPKFFQALLFRSHIYHVCARARLWIRMVLFSPILLLPRVSLIQFYFSLNSYSNLPLGTLDGGQGTAVRSSAFGPSVSWGISHLHKISITRGFLCQATSWFLMAKQLMFLSTWGWSRHHLGEKMDEGQIGRLSMIVIGETGIFYSILWSTATSWPPDAILWWFHPRPFSPWGIQINREE